ncbi:Ldh family oxidoreductase [Streptomyces sp. TLI_171]|uniref:Ldh family oxidoreductase n=1 Tax=Streptomyces sp. TLI_171 TaxID=1938859 RepID=UPI000C18D3AA|nr:Ldh family oxidoreductase [Streptomyces sp. TLI_171]RKE18165.1 LDH2 family malate/lactate/ureidoglycolate dehydrogenase [Streptomyces sp. TLI_171]
MTTVASAPTAAAGTVRVPYDDLLRFTTEVFVAHRLPAERAAVAAEALCYGDAAGMDSHGLANLSRLYLPLLAEGRADPLAEPVVLADRGAAVLVDAGNALGLWQAGAAMELAADRAERYGIGLVSVRRATHFGCAGHHAAKVTGRGMIGLLASNCGRQRIARPPGGAVALLGTNPWSVAAPAGELPPYVLDMSTTAVPTGRVRAAERAGRPVPEGWLADEDGRPVTDPGAFDRGEAHLLWLGAGAGGEFKGFGLGLMVEVLAALLPGAGLGPEPAALAGDGGPSGRDDDIGVFALAIAPATLRDAEQVTLDARTLFGTVLDCPPAGGSSGSQVAYPGWHEARRTAESRRDGVPLAASLITELDAVAQQFGIRPVSVEATR